MSESAAHLPSREELLKRARALLAGLDKEDMGYSEYDAAWVARVPKRGAPVREPAFPGLLETVRHTQRADGGWGPEQVDYVSSRILATLASVLALTEFDGHKDLARAKKGVAYVQKAWSRLEEEPDLTIGFELVAHPLMLELTRRASATEELRGLEQVLDEAKLLFDEKMSRLPKELTYWPELSLAFSLEFLHDKLNAKKARGLVGHSGTITASVAATAYYVIESGDETSYKALERLVERGNLENISYAVDTRLWETIWTLHNLHVAGLTADLKEECRYRLDFIHKHIGTHGLAWSTEISYGDSDDSAVAFKVLNDFGYKVDWSLLEQYEKPDGFVGFLAERGPSVSANAHVLEAIQHDGHLNAHHPRGEEWRDKAAQLLLRQRRAKGYWTDKWQVSPYYPTSCAVKALLDWKPSSAFRSLRWMQDTQRSDGGWGWFNRSSPEESAYALHVLTMSHFKYLKFQKELDAVKDLKALLELEAVQDLAKEPRTLEKDLKAMKHLKARQALSTPEQQQSFEKTLGADELVAMRELEKALKEAEALKQPKPRSILASAQNAVMTRVVLSVLTVMMAAMDRQAILKRLLKYRERLDYMRRWKDPVNQEQLVEDLEKQKHLLQRLKEAESLEAAKRLLQSEYLQHLKVDLDVIARGAAYLAQFDGTEPGDTHPKLWIAKVLYRPRNVVRATILAAQLMCAKVTELEAEKSKVVAA
ncbi:hypothetical protein [Archangium sp.]|jgi:hypothetical protein|uniref:hypothetical protein n=1 Tax=Archangium sp. TaxID=1872627 RepID=UPI002ED9A38E